MIDSLNNTTWHFISYTLSLDNVKNDKVTCTCPSIEINVPLHIGELSNMCWQTPFYEFHDGSALTILDAN